MSEIKDRQPDGSGNQGLPTARRDFLGRGAALLAGASLGWSGCTSQKETSSERDLASAPAARDEGFWSDIKKKFLINPDSIYLNNASLGIPPQPVLDAVAEHYRKISSNPTSAKGELHQHIQKVVLPALAELIGAETDEIAFMSNATEALDLITKGIPLQPGDEVLTTTHEHPAGIRPWRLRAERDGITLREIPIQEAAQQFFCNFRVGCGTGSSSLGSRVQKAVAREPLAVNLSKATSRSIKMRGRSSLHYSQRAIQRPHLLLQEKRPCQKPSEPRSRAAPYREPSLI